MLTISLILNCISILIIHFLLIMISDFKIRLASKEVVEKVKEERIKLDEKLKGGEFDEKI